MNDSTLRQFNVLFKTIENEPSSLSCTADDISKCMTIKRLLISLLYYDRLNRLIKNQKGKLLFCNFMDTIYKSAVYDDFFHLKTYHGDEIKSILNLATSQYKMPKCPLSKCSHSDRHYRIDQDATDNSAELSNGNDTKYFNLYRETMDALHFYVFHLEQGGLRIYDDNDDEKQDENESISPYFDSSFCRMSRSIRKSRESTERFTRLNGNKYNISAVNDVVDDIVGGDGTFLYHLYSMLTSTNDYKSNENTALLFEIIYDNGYDTDSLNIDIEIFKTDDKSNIFNILKYLDHDIMDQIVALFTDSKSYV